jgi:glycosyltransferase involved in cell wall biosynthesis
MKNCLMISALFPPQGGVGVQRITKFVKYLPENGWNPIVITIPTWGNKVIKDKTMYKDLSNDLDIYREFYFDYRKIIPGEIAKLFRTLERKYFYPDKYVIWNHFVLKRIQKILVNRKIDLAFINVPPFSGLTLSVKLKQKFNIPVVLTIRDPFSLNQYNILNSNIEAAREAKLLEGKAFKASEKIILVTPNLLKIYYESFPKYFEKFSLITNGFDADDFKKVERVGRNNVFEIAYNGTFSSITPLKPLLDAIYHLFMKENIEIKLNIATNLPFKKLKKLHSGCVKKNLINYLGFLPHKECINNIMSSDLLVVTLVNSPATDFVLTGKALEYINSHKPILLINNDHSDVANLIKSTKTGSVVNIDDHTEIVSKIKYYYYNWKKNITDLEVNEVEIQKFNYRNLTKQLGEIFDGLTR